MRVHALRGSQGNLSCRTALTNGNLGFRNISFGDGLLSSAAMLINGVENIQAVPKSMKDMVKNYSRLQHLTK